MPAKTPKAAAPKPRPATVRTAKPKQAAPPAAKPKGGPSNATPAVPKTSVRKPSTSSKPKMNVIDAIANGSSTFVEVGEEIFSRSTSPSPEEDISVKENTAQTKVPATKALYKDDITDSDDEIAATIPIEPQSKRASHVSQLESPQTPSKNVQVAQEQKISATRTQPSKKPAKPSESVVNTSSKKPTKPSETPVIASFPRPTKPSRTLADTSSKKPTKPSESPAYASSKKPAKPIEPSVDASSKQAPAKLTQDVLSKTSTEDPAAATSVQSISEASALPSISASLDDMTEKQIREFEILFARRRADIKISKIQQDTKKRKRDVESTMDEDRAKIEKEIAAKKRKLDEEQAFKIKQAEEMIQDQLHQIEVDESAEIRKVEERYARDTEDSA